MTAYLSIDLNPVDPDAIEDYESRMPPVLARYGARVIARDESPWIVEGRRTARIAVLIEFADRAAFQRFYESEDYAPLRAQRWDGARTDAIVLDGVEPAA